MSLRDAIAARTERPPLEGITINPASDRLFAACVRRAARASRSIADLEDRLRRSFPSAAVRPQASDGRGIPTWFVYRDGCWTNEMPAHIRARIGVPVGPMVRAEHRVSSVGGSARGPRMPVRS